MQGELPSQRITEGVIWKQLLFFFFPILLGSFFQQMYNLSLIHISEPTRRS